jgi:hypothetical protein
VSPAERPPPSGWDPKLVAGAAIVAIVLFAPAGAAEGQSPWPLALALAGVFAVVAFGGWMVLRRTPPGPEE